MAAGDKAPLQGSVLQLAERTLAGLRAGDSELAYKALDAACQFLVVSCVYYLKCYLKVPNMHCTTCAQLPWVWADGTSAGHECRVQLLGDGRQHPESASQSHMQLSAAISTSPPRFLPLLNACAGVRVALFPALPLGVAAAGGAPPALSRGATALHLCELE